MEEENPNSTESLIGKLQELFTDSENDVGQFPFKEEMVEKFMQELYKEIACSPVPKPLSPASAPAPTPLPSSHHLPPNPKHQIPETQNDGSLQVDAQEQNKMEQGFEEEDDEWLARVLGWGQVLDPNQSGLGGF